jgi:nucleoid-associated protein YgaU
MATKKLTANDQDLIIKPVFKPNSRMQNYEVVYDDSIENLRCAFYKNKLKDSSSVFDTVYEVEAGMEYRLDLISFKHYGTATFDWAIADANNISDPIKEVKVGTVLRIPSRNIIGA